MSHRSRAVLAAAALLCFTGAALAQSSPESQKENTGSVSGRITLDDKPAVGVAVLAFPGDDRGDWAPLAKATTDADGRYRLTGVPAGRYRVLAALPGYTSASGSGDVASGKPVILDEGEIVEGINIALVRGGVITGRVTDADGRPLIGQKVDLLLVPDKGKSTQVWLPHYFNSTTDDRGVYRIYGLSGGRYVVSAGEDPDPKMGSNLGGEGAWYTRTYFPGVADEAQASRIEVTAGSEAKNIDITVGRPSKRYRASGRIMEAETGKPLPDLPVGYGSISEERGKAEMRGMMFGPTRSNAKGEFQIDGLVPGRYAATVGRHEGGSDWYNDPAPFTVADRDVTGIELKVRRGVSITGVAVLEGTTDPAILAKLPAVVLFAQSKPESDAGLRAHWGDASVLQADGSFRFKGVAPGKVTIGLASWEAPKGISLLRLERDGVEQQGAIDVADGDEITGVRVVLGYGTGIIRGRIQVEGGAEPAGARFEASLSQVGSQRGDRWAEVDARRQFLFDGLVTGEYEVKVEVFVEQGDPATPPRRTAAKKTVSVASGSTSEAIVTIDLSRGAEGHEP